MPSDGIPAARQYASTSDACRQKSFVRPRCNTMGSVPGSSDVSASSAISDASPDSRSTIKRRFSSMDEVAKASRHIEQLRLSHADDEEPAEEQEKEDPPVVPQVSSLIKAYPSKIGGLELVILRQPEDHHRARYQKEGSRGCIKDRTGNTCPAVQLKGYCGTSAVLQAFIAIEFGRIRPHHLYRACRVGGKHSTPCRDQSMENTHVLEMDMLPENNWVVNVDCMGILKLRNADLDDGQQSDNRRKKRTPQVRIAFRAVVPGERGAVRTLQVSSTTICCTPSPGMPEIHRTSHSSCPPSGGGEVIILGRNFIKDETRIYMKEINEAEEVVWEAELPVGKRHFQGVHLTATLPAYKDLNIAEPVNVSITVRNKNKTSEPYPFQYVPALTTNSGEDDGFFSQDASGSSMEQSVNSPSASPDDAPDPVTSMPTSPISEVCPDTASSTGPDHTNTDQKTDDTLDPLVPCTSVVSSTTTLYQYLINPPGASFPIIITIPQVATGNEQLNPVPEVGLSGDTQIVQSGYSGMWNENEEILGGPSSSNAEQPTDEQIFDDILRDIMAHPDCIRDSPDFFR